MKWNLHIGAKIKWHGWQLVYWNDEECKSAVVASDDNYHTKDSILVSLEHLIKSLVNHDVARLPIWSDPYTQFKNCYIAAVLPELESTFCTKIAWNFLCHFSQKGFSRWNWRNCQTQIFDKSHAMMSSSTKHSIFLQMCSCMLYSSKHLPHTINIKQVSYQIQICLWEVPVLLGISKMHEFLVNCQTGLLYTFSSCPDRLSCWNNVTSDKLNFRPNIWKNFKNRNHDVSRVCVTLKQFGATLTS